MPHLSQRGALLLLSTIVSAASLAPTPSEISSAIQPLADFVSEKYACAISIAVVVPHPNKEAHTIRVASGGATVSDRFVWGSVTKTFTGGAILSLVESGKLDLDAPVAPIIDRMLIREHGRNRTMNVTSLRQLWGDAVDAVTARQLATMTSGVPDYDTAKPGNPPTDSFRAEVYSNPSRDYTPFDLISVPWVATGSLLFPPGYKQHYSSTNFVLLGLLAAELSSSSSGGAQSWLDFDQGAFLPAALRAKWGNSFTWAKTGSPAEVVSKEIGYDRTTYNGQPGTAPGIDDNDVHGVFAGWTASDWVATPATTAEWGHALYGSKTIVAADLVKLMVPNATESFYGERS